MDFEKWFDKNYHRATPEWMQEHRVYMKESWKAAKQDNIIMKTTIPKELIEKTRDFLGKDGLAFFKEMKEKYGEYAAVFTLGEGRCKIPYAVHFNEGRQVRNFMRISGFCDDWSDHEFDDNWVLLIEKVIHDK